MHGVYEALQREGKIGPFQMRDGQLAAKDYVEYPKWVRNAEGKSVIVKTLQEEIEVAGKVAPQANDPASVEKSAVLAELETLKAQNAEVEELKAQMKAQLAELATAREALQSGVAKVVAQQTPAGSKFRQPPSIPTEQPKTPDLVPTK